MICSMITNVELTYHTTTNKNDENDDNESGGA
jgi:hypothetical protein